MRLAAEKGFRDSFYAYFADDGIAFNPHPFRVRVALAGQPSTPAPMGADWAPVYGDVAAAGDLGWNTGPLVFAGRDGKPDRHGMFFSVWKRQPDGSFKVVLDIGSDTPSAVVPIDEPPHSSWRAGLGAAGAASTSLPRSPSCSRPKRRSSPTSTAESLGRAYASRLADDARVHRPGAMPVVGRVALDEWAIAQAGAVSRRGARSPMSRDRASSATPGAATNGSATRRMPATSRGSGRRTSATSGASSWTP